MISAHGLPKSQRRPHRIGLYCSRITLPSGYGKKDTSRTSSPTTSPSDSYSVRSHLELTRRTHSIRSAISSRLISTLSKSQMHTSCGRGAGLRPHTSCNLFTAMPLMMFIWKCLRKPSQRSKICVKPNSHTNKKRPAKRQIQRSTGFLNAGSGGRTRTK